MPFRLIAAPFTAMHADGSLNLSAVELQGTSLAESGVTGVFVAGSTGEGMSLTLDERFQLAKRWNEVGRPLGLEVIVQVGHNCQEDAIRLAAHAADLGTDAIAASAPNYFKPATVSALLDFCAPIADAARLLPFFFYDIPGMTGVRLPMVEFLTKGRQRIPGLVGIKYSNLDLVQLQECVRLDNGRFEVLFGCDEALLAGYVLGVCGAVGSTYNFAAPLYCRMLDVFESGDHAEARRLQAASVSLVRTLEAYSFLPAAKFAMSLAGIDCGPVRPPLQDLTPEQKSTLRAALLESDFPNICRVH
jgi:N-acetylneuraminate lyase